MARVENPNVTFRRNWEMEMGNGSIDLSKVDAKDREALAKADKSGDGKISMREARDHLIVSSQVRSDGEATNFRAAINHIFAKKPGAVDDVMNAGAKSNAHVCYIQLNNAANGRLVEQGDLEGCVARDPDHPSLDTANLTAGFNTNGDRAKGNAAFKQYMRQYMDGLIARGERMTGFVLSGHSNGTYMLQEAEHHMYHANLDPRQVLRELRAENPAYAKLMDSCEKVGLLACFQGGAAEEWAELFPNATIAGTREFAPASADHASAAIYDAAATTNQKLEDGLDTPAAVTAGFNVRNNAVLRQRDLNIRTPQKDMARVREALDRAKGEYNTIAADITKMRQNGGAGFPQAKLDDAYRIANAYYLARQGMWIAEGRPGGANGAEAQELAKLDFERRDLFAIRKHMDRPVN